jgi:hypothetical protein
MLDRRRRARSSPRPTAAATLTREQVFSHTGVGSKSHRHRDLARAALSPSRARSLGNERRASRASVRPRCGAGHQQVRLEQTVTLVVPRREEQPEAETAEGGNHEPGPRLSGPRARVPRRHDEPARAVPHARRHGPQRGDGAGAAGQLGGEAPGLPACSTAVPATTWSSWGDPRPSCGLELMVVLTAGSAAERVVLIGGSTPSDVDGAMWIPSRRDREA